MLSKYTPCSLNQTFKGPLTPPPRINEGRYYRALWANNVVQAVIERNVCNNCEDNL